MMSKLGKKIAISIIVGGIFIVVSFISIDYQGLTPSAYGVIVALLVFIFLFGFSMGNSFALPLSEILNNAYNVNKGEAKKIDLKKETNDEVDDLAKVFNSITQNYQGLKEESESIKKNSDIKLKTKELLSSQVVIALEEKIRNRTADLEKAISELNELKHQLALKDEQVFNLNKIVEAKRKRKG